MKISHAPFFVDRVHGNKKLLALLDPAISALHEFKSSLCPKDSYVKGLREIGKGEEHVIVAHSNEEWDCSL